MQPEELAIRWRQQANDSREEAGRIRRTIKAPTDAEERCNVRAEVWDQCANELLADTAITVAWLHSIKPNGWRAATRGIDFANWTIHSVRSGDDESGYDAGPFVWTVAPTHGANMIPLENSGNRFFTILVLETREDVLALLGLLGKGSEVVPQADWEDWRPHI